MDANGDGVGDLPGITQRLDYIASLGVDAVWISPIQKSPMKDFGYDVSDYDDVDPTFGTLADFDALIARAHQLGLKVMIDQVLSHTSDQHPWFAESRSNRTNPKADWYVWADALPDGSPPNNWKSVFGGSSWQWDTRRKQYYLHNFLAEQPDLNYHNPEVQQAALASIRFWLQRGLDGFRFDTTNYFHHDTELRNNPPLKDSWDAGDLPANPYEMQQHLFDKNRPENVAFFEKVRSVLNEHGAVSVGEVGDAEGLNLMIEYTAGPKRLHMTYSFAFLGKENHAAHVRRHTQAFEAAAAPTGSWPCWTVGNHDSIRVLTRWQGEQAPKDFTRMAMAMLFSLRGSSCWYQGDELALPEAELAFEDLVDPPGIAFWPEYKGRDGCRTPMPWQSTQVNAGFTNGVASKPWLPVVAAHQARALDVAEADPDAPLHFMRSFLAWRKQHPALVTGDVTYLDGGKETLVWVRQASGSGQALCVAVNLTAEPQAVELPEAKATWLTQTVPGLPLHQQGRVDASGLALPAYGVWIGLG
jgi:alpha-glucosidase